MKKIHLTFISILIASSIQSQTYYSFPDSNAIWNNKISWGIYVTINRFGVFGDTIIDNQLYNKLYMIVNDSTLNPNNMNYYAAIRENSTKQIFVKLENDPGEILLYDFSLNIGDTINSNSPSGYLNYDLCIIADIDTIELENNQFRRIFKINDYGIDYWIEGIGSIDGLFNPIASYIIGSGGELLCYKQNDTVVYINNPGCDKCFCSLATAISDPAKKNNSLIIYPNPGTTEIFIEPPFEIGISTINLYNSNGNLINTLNASSFPLKLKIKDLPLGIYFIRVVKGDLIYVQKFIKNE